MSEDHYDELFARHATVCLRLRRKPTPALFAAQANLLVAMGNLDGARDACMELLKGPPVARREAVEILGVIGMDRPAPRRPRAEAN